MYCKKQALFFKCLNFSMLSCPRHTLKFLTKILIHSISIQFSRAMPSRNLLERQSAKLTPTNKTSPKQERNYLPSGTDSGI
jgi:hypothetical protein